MSESFHACFSSTTIVWLILKRHKLHRPCSSVGSETKPCRLWPPGEPTIHFHISNPHSDSDTYCSLYRVMVIVEMNMMAARLMAAVVMMSMMMIAFCYCCQWRRQVFHRWRGVQQICWLHQVDSRGPGLQQRDTWNHIKWNECDWAPGLPSTHRPPTVSGLHREGQRRRIQILQAIYRRVYGGLEVCTWTCVYSNLRLRVSLVWSWNNEKDTHKAC